MFLYYTIVAFIFGTILGSFYNVVGYRLPKGESLISPSSHCTNCNHKLGPLELIPIFSFLFLGGKCKKCGQKISWFYPIFEFSTGVLFALSYIVFGPTIDFFIAITFVSTLLVVVLSDYKYMIIPDEVVIFSSIVLLIELFIKSGLKGVGYSLLSGFISAFVMFMLKVLGDHLFKKESMGGGDIKLLFIFGLVINYPMAIISIFLGSFIGLPISIYILYKEKTNIIPFGPFLSVAALIIYFTNIDLKWILDVLTF
jgi:leader peptidase (prepilin peptidase)/N-methyltransferase